MHDQPISIPRCLDWIQVYHAIACCFRPSKNFTKYKEALDTVDLDLQRNLDILNMLRRMKMHGLALSVLLDNPSRRFISNHSFDKPLEYVKETSKNMPEMLWLRFELISRPEKIMIAIFTRYLMLKARDNLNKKDAVKDNSEEIIFQKPKPI